jgi:hypothetical protein
VPLDPEAIADAQVVLVPALEDASKPVDECRPAAIGPGTLDVQ